MKQKGRKQKRERSSSYSNDFLPNPPLLAAASIDREMLVTDASLERRPKSGQLILKRMLVVLRMVRHC